MRCRSPARSTRAAYGHRGHASHRSRRRRRSPRSPASCRRSRSAPGPCCAPTMSPRGARRRAVSGQPRHDPGTCRRRAGDRAALSPRRRHPVRDHGGAGARHLRDEVVSGRGARRHRLLRALAPVFPGIAFCPTGGIDERPRRTTWRCPTCRWSAAHGWRRATRSPPATGRASAASPNAPPRSAAPRRLKTVNWLLVVQSFSIENSRNIFFHSCFSRLRLFG